MNDRDLRTLLNRAESDVEWTRLAPDRIAHRAVERLAARRLRRRLATVFLPVLLIVGGVVTTNLVRQSNQVAAVQQAEQLRRQFEFHLQQMRTALQEAELARSAEHAAFVAAFDDPYFEIDVQLDITAAQMMLRADRMLREQRSSDEIVGMYQRIVHLFPDTRAAGEARRRLNEMPPAGET